MELLGHKDLPDPQAQTERSGHKEIKVTKVTRVILDLKVYKDQPDLWDPPELMALTEQ